jgi:F-type H+-transporting ATPase subunit a
VLGVTILGLLNNGLKFFAIFVPAGCPLALLPLLVIIEFISYVARCFSLGLRLGANIFSGHLLLTILSGFTYKIMTFGFAYFIAGLFPLAFIIAFSGLEIAIAFIQSIVFVILTSSYLKDGLELHSSDARKSTILNIKASINRFVIINKRNISTLSNPQNTIVRRFSSTGSYNNSSPLFFENADTDKLEILEAGKNKSGVYL